MIFLLAMLGGSTAAVSQMADVAGALPGDQWTYEIKDEITGDLKHTVTIVVLDVSDKEINTRVSTRGMAGTRQIVFDRNWSRIDDSTWKYTPSDGTGIQASLRIGEEWRFASKARHFKDGIAVSTSGHSKVVGQEPITTSAGTFDAFKIDTTMRQTNSNDQTKTATIDSTLWYAPSINRWVRKTYKVRIEGRLRDSQSEELTDYSRKP